MKKFKVTVTRTTYNKAVHVVLADNEIEARNIIEGDLEGDSATESSVSNSKNIWDVEELGEVKTSQKTTQSNKKEKSK